MISPFSSFRRAPGSLSSVSDPSPSSPKVWSRPLPGSLPCFPYTFEPDPCLTLLKNRGPVIQTLHKSRTICTFGRRPFSPEDSSALFYMVCRHTLLLILFLLTSFVRFIGLGMVIMLFFQCMSALFDPANRRGEGTKWGLIVYTVLMLSFVTIYTGMISEILSTSFVDNREFPGLGDKAPPGPIGFKFSIHPKAITVVSSLMFLLNNWLADGLLVCFVPPIHLLRDLT